jgi:NAD-dependent dihydropyrimidine dehydrogenase PreA subunit
MIRAYDTNTLMYDPDLCTGCEMCSIVCPHGVFVQNDDLASMAHPKRCMECGACQINCPTGAITVESGVGCAYALMRAAIAGKPESAACCGGGDDVCCG